MQNKTNPEKVEVVVSKHQEEEKEEGQGNREEQEQGGERSIKMTTRDREMLGHVALLKYAAERHSQRLVFASPVVRANRRKRTGEALDIGVMRRKLRQLSRGAGANDERRRVEPHGTARLLNQALLRDRSTAKRFGMSRAASQNESSSTRPWRPSERHEVRHASCNGARECPAPRSRWKRSRT